MESLQIKWTKTIGSSQFVNVSSEDRKDGMVIRAIYFVARDELDLHKSWRMNFVAIPHDVYSQGPSNMLGFPTKTACVLLSLHSPEGLRKRIITQGGFQMQA